MTRFSRTVLSALFPCVLGMVIFPANTLANYDPAKDYREIPAIVKQFPEPSKIDMGTPAFAADKTDFTSQREMEDFINQLTKTSDSLKVRIIGQSQKGNNIPLLVFSDSQSVTPEILLKNGKPTVLILALQHGNEPAPGEAALAYAKSLAEGKEGDVLSRVNVLIIPRANPDGAESFSRDLANGINLNRDHLLLSSPESRAIAQVFNQYQPDVVLDGHEYSVAGRWVEKFGAVQRYDAMLQQATTNNLPTRLAKTMEKPFRESIVNTFETNGLSHSWYYTTDKNNMQDKTLSMGGIGADTLRNIAGLRNSVSFLLENRGVGLGKAHYARRVYTQLLAMQAIVKTAAKNSKELIELGRDIRKDISNEAGQGAIVVKGKATPEKHTVLMIDAKTADGVKVEADWNSSLNITPVITRSRPYAYLLASTEKKAAQQLQTLGVEVYRVNQAQQIKAQQYSLTEQKDARKKDVTGSVGTTGNTMTQVTTRVEDIELPVDEGYYYIPLKQPLANLVIAALEPETQGSFIANGLITLPAKAALTKTKGATAKGKVEIEPKRLPLYRLPESAELSLTLMQ
ncbi:M14 family metallocarboxypeptidase [Pragia fontium]|uniref:M14 family metallopeptidase n=1 Tax=Pragia fontium TaxID=82985 RepID=UPI00069A5805|nr:M14 family metallocarboxypeptidase [Pragia fontium]